jgi:predicted nucleic acid-binding protein
LLFTFILAGGIYGISKLISSDSPDKTTKIEAQEEVKLKPNEKDIQIIEETKSSGSFEEPIEKKPRKPPVKKPAKVELEDVRIVPEKIEEVLVETAEKIETRIEPAGIAVVTISADKAATVFIDGKKIKSAPLFKYKLSIGTHRVHIATPSGQIKKFSVDISAGDSLIYQWSFSDSKWIHAGK